MIKIIMIFDQIQSGLGTKDDKMLALGGSKEAIGPAVMLAPYLKDIDAKVVACLYCGDGTYAENPEIVREKLCSKLEKLNPDIVICGPSLNYEGYSKMCAEIAYDINEKTNIKAIAAMSKENEQILLDYKDKILIVETPKKGGTGLNDSLKNIVKVVKKVYDKEEFNSIKEEFCFK